MNPSDTLPGVGRPGEVVRDRGGCAPFWNYRARWALLILGPVLLLLLEITVLGWLGLEGRPLWELPGIGWSALDGRDFWVPLLWGLWMPWFNGPRSPVPGMKRIVFRDFNGNDFLPLGIPLMHGLLWAGCAHLPLPAAVRPPAFAAAFLVYDILLLRYALLEIWTPGFAVPIRPRRVVRSFLTFWWLYLGTGLAIVHAFGGDAPLPVLGSAAALIAPMQLFLLARRRPPEEVPVRRVAVLGAGWSGVYAAKWLLQAGLDVRVYERGETIGGLWRYDEAQAGGVAEATFASSSTYYMHASDFPMRTAPFPRHEEVAAFIARYADAFGVRERVSFGTRVESVRRDADGWRIRGGGPDGASLDERFDAVVVAAGVNGEPPDLTERYAGFTGALLHSSRYKHAGCLGGHRRVLVVGLGESGADVAHECAGIRGTEVHLSGTGQWFAGRFVNGNFPADTLMAPGVRTLLAPFVDFETRGRRIVQSLIGIMWGNGGSGVALWQPPVPWLHGFVTKSRSAVDDVHEGRVTPHARIARCSGRTVEFEDGTRAEVDLIIDCTGFAPSFPFLEDGFSFEELHRLVFLRDEPTLAFVGTARPVLGSIPALAEMQARWIAAVYSGRVTLPHLSERRMDAFFRGRAHRKRFFSSPRRPNLVDHEFYAAEIARDCGVAVPWWSLLLRRPGDFRRLLIAPWTAFKYDLATDVRRATGHIREFLPRSAVYHHLIRGRFLRMAGYMWAMRIALLALALAYVPPALLAAVGATFLVQRGLRRARDARARLPGSRPDL